MKKILACAICLLSMVAANSSFASNATAVTASTGAITLTTGTNPPLIIQLSSNVSMTYQAESTGLYYSISAYHTKGSRTYTSTSNDSKIFYQDATGVTGLDVPTTSGSSAPGKWTIM